MSEKTGRIPAGIIGGDDWALGMAGVIAGIPELDLRCVACADEGAMARWKNDLPQVNIVKDWEQLLEAGPALVFLSVESFKARNIVESLLSAKVSVLASAPWDDSVSGVEELSKLAEEQGVLLRVDKEPLYSPAFEKALADLKDLRELFGIEYRSAGFGGVRSDLGVHWVRGFKPLAVMARIFGGWPQKQECQAGSYLKHGISDRAYMTFLFPEGRTAHVKVGWYEAAEEEMLVISGAWGMYVLEFGTEKHSLSKHDKRIRYLDGQIRVKREDEVVREEFEAKEAGMAQIRRLLGDLQERRREDVSDVELANLLGEVDVSLKLSNIIPAKGAD